MVGKKKSPPTFDVEPAAVRVTSVLGPGINWKGDLRGKGGVRIEGTMEGEIAIQGLVVIGETGKVTCQMLQAETVIVAGAVKGNIRCGKLEIRATGRVWGDVVKTALSRFRITFQLKRSQALTSHLLRNSRKNVNLRAARAES